jgi:UPF0176 protein
MKKVANKKVTTQKTATDAAVPQYTILLYYKYVAITDPTLLMHEQRALCTKLGFKSRIIVSHEGINGTLEGTTDKVDEYVRIMQADKRFADIHFKKSKGTPDGTAFPKISVKVRKEIVSAHLDESDIDPNKMTGKRLKPEDLHKWYEEGREFEIVDMRNGYEHKSGHFDGSILPRFSNFRDLPKATDDLEKAGLKKKTVLTVCTGGVRCEKASGYLVKRGFEDVYQLDGGIVTYMEKFPGKDFLGSLYVFDKRKVMNFDEKPGATPHVVVGKCMQCELPSEHYINCGNEKCHLHFICCENCVEANKGYCKKCSWKRIFTQWPKLLLKKAFSRF